MKFYVGAPVKNKKDDSQGNVKSIQYKEKVVGVFDYNTIVKVIVEWSDGMISEETEDTIELLGPMPIELGMKLDHEKLRWDLLPVKVMKKIVEVLMYGCKKYAAYNWLKVKGWKWRYYNAAKRHLEDWWDEGLEIDPESGLHNIDMAITNLIFLRGKMLGVKPPDYKEEE